MPNLTLAPEEDDPRFPNGLRPSPLSHKREPHQATELQELKVRFDPAKIGFGILPWPATADTSEATDKVALAMSYLLAGKNLRQKGEKK